MVLQKMTVNVIQATAYPIVPADGCRVSSPGLTSGILPARSRTPMEGGCQARGPVGSLIPSRRTGTACLGVVLGRCTQPAAADFAVH